jgi:hypothetical protein
VGNAVNSEYGFNKENRLRRKVQIKKFGNCSDHYWWEMQLILNMLNLSSDYLAASYIMFKCPSATAE